MPNAFLELVRRATVVIAMGRRRVPESPVKSGPLRLQTSKEI